MSPILVRPVREQLEHDRVIRLLQAKYKRKFEVAINPGHEQTVPVLVGTSPWYPDLVLQSTDRARKLLGTVEVETAESVNQPRGDVAVGGVLEIARAVSPLRSGVLHRHGKTVVRRPADRGGGNLGLQRTRRSDALHPCAPVGVAGTGTEGAHRGTALDTRGPPAREPTCSEARPGGC